MARWDEQKIHTKVMTGCIAALLLLGLVSGRSGRVPTSNLNFGSPLTTQLVDDAAQGLNWEYESAFKSENPPSTGELPPAVPSGINLKNQESPIELLTEIVDRIMSGSFQDQAYALKAVEAVSAIDQLKLLIVFEEFLGNCNERYRLLLRADSIGDYRIDDYYESDLDTSNGRMRVIFQAEALAFGMYLTGLPDAAKALRENADNPIYGQMLYDYAVAIEQNKPADPPARLQSVWNRIP